MKSNYDGLWILNENNDIEENNIEYWYEEEKPDFLFIIFVSFLILLSLFSLFILFSV